jgi:hypothetical protein
MPGFEFSNLDSLYLLPMYDSVDRWVDGAHAAADADKFDEAGKADKADRRIASDDGRRQADADEVDHV